MKELQQAIYRLAPWFHNLHLPDGVQTCPEHPLGDFPNVKWQRLGPFLPADLHGATVLDIGCNAGFYSFELAKRGARVTALDASPHYLEQARWAARVLGLSDRVEFQERQIYELASERRTWDIVLFLGLIYHLRYPLLGLDIVSRCVGQTLAIQSVLAPGAQDEPTPFDLELSEREPLIRSGWPKLSFIERRFAGDPSNWWVPNQPCLAAMVRSSGFKIVSQPLEEFFLCEPDPQGETSVWRSSHDEYWAATGQRRP